MTTGWASTRLRLRSEVRRRRAGFVLLVVVVALSAGVAMAAAAGARRSNTAYERLRHWSGDPELMTGGCDCTEEELAVALERLATAPFVLDSVRAKLMYVELRLPNGIRMSPTSVLPVVDDEGRLGRDLPRAKLIEGRLPDPAAVFEASIGFNAADRYELTVGDEVRLIPRKSGVAPVSEPIRIVGIHAFPGQFPSVTGPTRSTLLLTPAFADSYTGLSRAEDDSLMVRFRPGTAREEVGAYLESLGVEFDVLESSRLTSGIERTIRIETIALVVLGIVVAAMGLVVVGQILRRQSTVPDDEWVTWLALGTTRRDILRLGLGRGAAVGLIGATLAVVVAFVISPLFPVGIGRIADPHIGLHFDALALALGAVLTMVVVAGTGVLVAPYGLWWGRRQYADNQPRDTKRSFPSRRPSTLVGLYLVRHGRAGVRSSPARISFVSLLVVITLLAAAVVTVASFGHLVARRDLAGATWHAAFHPLSADNAQPDLEASVAAVRRVRGVETATNSGWQSQGDFHVDGRPVDAQVFTHGAPIGPAISRGRAPHMRGEIALGAKTLAELQRGLGDEVKLSLTPDGPFYRRADRRRDSARLTGHVRPRARDRSSDRHVHLYRARPERGRDRPLDPHSLRNRGEPGTDLLGRPRSARWSRQRIRSRRSARRVRTRTDPPRAHPPPRRAVRPRCCIRHSHAAVVDRRTPPGRRCSTSDGSNQEAIVDIGLDLCISAGRHRMQYRHPARRRTRPTSLGSHLRRSLRRAPTGYPPAAARRRLHRPSHDRQCCGCLARIACDPAEARSRPSHGLSGPVPSGMRGHKLNIRGDQEMMISGPSHHCRPEPPDLPTLQASRRAC